MKILMVLILATATLCAAEPDVKNLAVGSASYGVARGAFALTIERTWGDENPYWVKAIGAGVASFALATFASTVVENFQTGDTAREAKKDTNARMYGALMTFGLELAVRGIVRAFD
jgi:hypothetical protein